MIDRSAQLVTVFGGDGFIGRYVCELLMKNGARIRVASRNPRRAFFIQPLGQVGQFGFVRADVTDADSVRRAIDGATAVVNLVGVFGPAMQSAHVDGARHVAEAAKECGAEALVHISATSADPQSESKYGRTKGEGEAAVRKAYPKATIIRPSLVFGPEDDLTNRFARMAQLPFLPVIAAKTNFQPVYVRDLAQAIALAALDPGGHGGKTYEIGGPARMNMVELHRAILAVTGQTPDVVALPDLFGTALSYFGWLPGAPLTRDQWMMLKRDNVPSGKLPGLEAFGITPTPLGAVGHEWLGRFRGNRFAARRVNQAATH
ncbi:MAG: complex I NDUFA9 subunit family protein [Sphingomicrobium sp.]